MPKTVVVIGGSLAGLMQALQLKRHGHNVTVLEQDRASDRDSHEAGVAFEANMDAFLKQYDATGLTMSLPSETVRVAYRRRWPRVRDLRIRRRLSSWGFLYRILRANFDGFVSEACRTPPGRLEDDGEARYLSGTRVEGLVCQGELMTVSYVNLMSGKEESIDADLVIGADGVHSTVRKLVAAPMVAEKSYAGYVTWRGTVEEKLVSKETVDYFADKVVFQSMKRTYMVVYMIPTDNGGCAPGERLINFAWYYNIPDGSSEMTELLTDVNGTVHKNTVPRKLVNPSVWIRVRDSVIPQMTPPVAELVSAMRTPFVTKVNDVLCATPSFFDGKVLLVGDAFATIRPHIAVATDQAALHAIEVMQVLKGESKSEDWSRAASGRSRRLWLLSRVLGEFGQGTWRMFLKASAAYMLFVIQLKLGKW